MYGPGSTLQVWSTQSDYLSSLGPNVYFVCVCVCAYAKGIFATYIWQLVQEADAREMRQLKCASGGWLKGPQSEESVDTRQSSVVSVELVGL